MKSVFDFFKKMLSSSDEVSSKRFWGSLTFLSALILSYLTILGSCNDIAINKLSLINTMYLAGGVMLGLGLVEIFKKQ